MKTLSLILLLLLFSCAPDPLDDCGTITSYEYVLGEGTPVEDYLIIVLDYDKRYTIPIENYKGKYPKPHLGIYICIDERDATSRQ